MVYEQIVLGDRIQLPVAVLTDSQSVVKKAGEILLSYYQGALTRQYKKDGSFATQADHASEKCLIAGLTDIVPGAGFYAEESGVSAGNDYCWVIDPLDGTTNFSQKIPYFCISVALTYKNVPIMGIVYQPVLQELFVGILGGGAFLNGVALASLTSLSLKDSYISCTNSYEVESRFFALKQIIEPRVSSIRIFGASALDIAYCAAGKIDGSFFEGLCWWDMAAGSVLLKEVGGTCSTFEGTVIGPEKRSFVGGSELIFQELSQLIQKNDSV